MEEATTRDSARTFTVAAVGDLHYSDESRGSLSELVRTVNREADVLALLGDLTTHGRVRQVEQLVEDLAPVEVPIVCVLGNHDHEAGEAKEITRTLCDAGVHVLDGDSVVIEGVGFAGTKGFAGGFGRGALAPFGEDLIKEFVQHALDEALKLENALRALNTPVRVALLHYAPTAETLVGEPEIIYPFLGSSRLLQPIETMEADVVFHGHAHHGTRHAVTAAGLPVYNVALPLLREDDEWVHLWTIPLPDRRGGEDDGSGETEAVGPEGSVIDEELHR